MSETLLLVEGLTRRFGAVVALNDISFAVKRGEIKAIIGPNGAGKTTLFDGIAGMLPMDAGRVTFKGRDLGGTPTHERARDGLVRTFQNVKIFEEMSVLENVMVGRHARSRAELLGAMLRLPWTRREERAITESARGALALVGLERRAAESAAALSYGELKILEIARALATDPVLLLLDEPVAGVSSVEVERVREVVRKVNEQGVTVLLVEHNMRVVMSLSHSIAVLQNGRKIAEGAPEAIRADAVVRAAYLGEKIDLAAG